MGPQLILLGHRLGGPALALALPVALALTGSASAQGMSPTDSVSLEGRIRILEQKSASREGTAALPPGAPARAADAKGFTWTSADGANTLRIGGYVHSDGRFFTGDDERPATSTLTLRRVRPLLEATVAKSFDLRIMPDWGGGAATLQDAYLEFRADPKLKIRTGKFKPPVGYERLMSATAIVFAERALPTNLVPNRDVGLQVSGDLAGGALSYAVGLFDGAADGGSSDTDLDDDKEGAGRIFAVPFRHSKAAALKGLGFGVAASAGDNTGTPTATGLGSVKSPGQQTLFSYRSNGKADSTVVAQGRRLRWSPQASWYAGRFGGYGEYVESSQEIRLGSAAIDHELRAWAITGSLALTRDEITSRGVTPKRPFDTAAGQWGALTLDGRYSALTVEASAFPIFASPTSSVSKARAAAAGLSWILNRYVKIVVDYEETHYDGGASTAQGGDRETERVVFARTQFAF